MTTTSQSTPDTEMTLSRRQERAIAARDAIEAGARPVALVPHTFLEAQAFCAALAQSDLVPQKLKDHAPDVLVIVLAGIELGLTPMQSLRLHHVIEGVPRLSADGIAAIIQASDRCEYLECSESTETRATWVTKRRGRPERSCTWTIDRAKRAGLTERKNRDGSPGMWAKYPENMLSARAKAELCRLVYPDIAAGLVSREEVLDGGAIDAEFRDVPAPPPVFTAPATPVTTTAPVPPAPTPSTEVRRGPGRPPRQDRPMTVAENEERWRQRQAAIETTATEVPNKLDQAIDKVEAKASPTPSSAPTEPSSSTSSASSAAPSTTATSNGASLPATGPAPAADDGFGDDPEDVAMASPETLADYHSWLASCKTQRELAAGKAKWMAWSKEKGTAGVHGFEKGGHIAKQMQIDFATRNSQVPA